MRANRVGLEQKQAEMRERMERRRQRPKLTNARAAFERAIEQSEMSYGDFLNVQATRFGITIQHCENLVRQALPMPDGTPLGAPVPAMMVRESWRLSAAFVKEVKELRDAVRFNKTMSQIEIGERQ
ncbi:MAG TPA: hypothetical protein VKR59_07810 [Terriglobales bacterium]|nr:hypothetical protein [Terriglobales bacterium]